MKNLAILTAMTAIAATSVLHAQATPASAAGAWTQSSSGKELVLVPRIKLQPNVGVSYGTSLGGTAGYGSPTRTTIVTEPVLMQVTRSMTLEVGEGGRFIWQIAKRHAEKEGCRVTTTQVKQGRVTQEGGKAILVVEDGKESFESSCGRQGSSRLAQTSEKYDVQLGGGRMVLRSGATQWTFLRG
ncbi:MAG TPA: hypothetical protein VN047_02310 [Sphingopyxis sp.]|uniref:hypothetical protein n=1 Tax=Sphingopyxis sp. TaxID=1908224 RepID=UPI002C887D1F|nr:hypothetical protein [Sphingopyxis sp.]HWW55703.1 hypothetical protein [Sphingopyxis sp.]